MKLKIRSHNINGLHNQPKLKRVIKRVKKSNEIICWQEVHYETLCKLTGLPLEKLLKGTNCLTKNGLYVSWCLDFIKTKGKGKKKRTIPLFNVTFSGLPFQESKSFSIRQYNEPTTIQKIAGWSQRLEALSTDITFNNILFRIFNIHLECVGIDTHRDKQLEVSAGEFSEDGINILCMDSNYLA